MFERVTLGARHVFVMKNGRNEMRKCLQVATENGGLENNEAARWTLQLLYAQTTGAHVDLQRSYEDDGEASLSATKRTLRTASRNC
jgi:hypothetical protein